MDNANNFNPIPKRFMVWDRHNKTFRINDGDSTTMFDIPALLSFFLYQAQYGIPYTNFDLIQSTNLFDKDGEEIFEGSLVRDFDESVGVVYYDLEDGEYRAKSADGDSFELAESSCDLKVLGHILSNPKLLEEKNV